MAVWHIVCVYLNVYDCSQQRSSIVSQFNLARMFLIARPHDECERSFQLRLGFKMAAVDNLDLDDLRDWYIAHRRTSTTKEYLTENVKV